MLLYLDTCIVIYLVEEHQVYGPVIETVLADTTADLCFSPLVELECLVLPLRQNHTLLLEKYRGFFAVNKRLDIPHEVFLEAAALRARHGAWHRLRRLQPGRKGGICRADAARRSAARTASAGSHTAERQKAASALSALRVFAGSTNVSTALTSYDTGPTVLHCKSAFNLLSFGLCP